MAVNVFLTFQTTTIQVNLQKLEKWYCLIGYGIPGVPAITYLLLDVTRGTDYYGDATVRLLRYFFDNSLTRNSFGVGFRQSMILCVS